MRRSLAQPQVEPRTSRALANMRGIVILIVLAFHSMLAYLQWIPAKASAFDSPPYDWRAFPVIDGHRFLGFDIFCAWQDVYLMSLMFFLSGLFVWPSLLRKREWGFLRDRVMRLGVPFVFGVLVIIPIAIYPVFWLGAADASFDAYLNALLDLPFWPNGPLWFIWQLLALNALAVAVHMVVPQAVPALGRWSATGDREPLRYFGILLIVSALAYVPLAVAFTPWAWSNSGPLALQFCRPLQYTVYFFAGVGIGAADIERGLIAAGGILARRWTYVVGIALGTLFLWMGLTGLSLNGGSAPVAVAADVSFVPACAAGCFCLIALCLRFATIDSRTLNYLSANAYGLYLVHYVFIVWMQFALLGAPLFALIKAPLVFVVTLGLSVLTIAAARHIPLGARLIGAAPRAVVTS